MSCSGVSTGAVQLEWPPLSSHTDWHNCVWFRLNQLLHKWLMTHYLLAKPEWPQCRGLVQTVFVCFCWRSRTLSPCFMVLFLLFWFCLHPHVPSPSSQHQSCEQQHPVLPVATGCSLTVPEAWFWSGGWRVAWRTAVCNTVWGTAVTHNKNRYV